MMNCLFFKVCIPKSGVQGWCRDWGQLMSWRRGLCLHLLKPYFTAKILWAHLCPAASLLVHVRTEGRFKAGFKVYMQQRETWLEQWWLALSGGNSSQAPNQRLVTEEWKRSMAWWSLSLEVSNSASIWNMIMFCFASFEPHITSYQASSSNLNTPSSWLQTFKKKAIIHTVAKNTQ